MRGFDVDMRCNDNDVGTQLPLQRRRRWKRDLHECTMFGLVAIAKQCASTDLVRLLTSSCVCYTRRRARCSIFGDAYQRFFFVRSIARRDVCTFVQAPRDHERGSA